MLSRPERLTSRQFDAAFATSRTFRDARLSLRVHWRAGEPSLRAAFVVPKKQGKATYRNAARRRMQEAFRVQREALQVLAARAGACDCIFLAQPNTENLSFEALQESVRALLTRAVEDRARGRNARRG